ncbi:MAG: hypothetical protein NTY19_03345 [Planctomycetota bacterium]|nr:hypothetical protein [Planctomycetota bacterium]
MSAEDPLPDLDKVIALTEFGVLPVQAARWASAARATAEGILGTIDSMVSNGRSAPTIGQRRALEHIFEAACRWSPRRRKAENINASGVNTVTVPPISLCPDDDGLDDDDDLDDDDCLDREHNSDDEDYEWREYLLELGLDPDNPDFTELAPDGMSGDEDDDEHTENEDVILADADDRDLEHGDDLCLW